MKTALSSVQFVLYSSVLELASSVS
jgi:hypothetical protein